MTSLFSEVYDLNFTVGESENVLDLSEDVLLGSSEDVYIDNGMDILTGGTSENALVFYFYEDVYEDNGNNVDNEDILTFEDNYPCSYEGCKDGNFFLKILKYKKIRSPPN